MLFVTKGTYDFGYEVNKKKMFRRQYGRDTIFGGFEVTFRNRHIFLVRTHSELQGFAVQKTKWLLLLDEFNQFRM